MDQVLDAKCELLRHTVATLAYRTGKTLRDAPASFHTMRIHDTTRTPAEILAHIGDLLDWALSLAKGKHEWHDSVPQTWDDEVSRFLGALQKFDAFLASGSHLEYPPEKLFQGPIADALTHVGQIAMLRRLAGSPIRGENYSKADIIIGRISLDQSSVGAEFD
jgi:hypothetical protein